MKHKTRSKEFNRFDKAMDGLLAIPYKERQEKLQEEKKAKAAAPKRSQARIENGKKGSGGQ